MRRIVTASALAATLAGCGDPYATDPLDPGRPHGEQPSTPVTEPTPTAPRTGASTPEQAGRQAADLAGNWTAATVADRYTELAARSTGAARIEAERIAAQAGTDPQLAAPGARSIAIVHAVTATGPATRKRLIIVTHETLTADGIRHARWRVTLAEAQRHDHGWVLSRWEPQP